MEVANTVLPIILSILGSILLIILIIFSVRLLSTLKKIDLLIDNINNKASQLDNLFSIVDATSNKLSYFSSKVIDGIIVVLEKIFSRRKDDESE